MPTRPRHHDDGGDTATIPNRIGVLNLVLPILTERDAAILI
jgi:hypothetical protein